MAVTGVHEYANAYAAENAGASENNVSNKTTREYLSELKRKYPDANIVVADFSSEKQRKAYSLGCAGYNNIAISPGILEKMATDPEMAAKYEKVIAETPKLGEESKKHLEAEGVELIAYGTVIDKNGKVSYWGVGRSIEAVENPGTVYKEKVQEQLKEKRAEKKAEEKAKEKRLAEAETMEKLLEKMKKHGKEETVEKIAEAGKGTQMDVLL